MPIVEANGIEIMCEPIGNPADPAFIMINGLGGQLIGSSGFVFDEDLCRRIAAAGFYVIRFDNRDVGLSTKFDGAAVPDLMETLARAEAGKPVAAPYTIADMADDAAALLTALGIEKAHVCGASMGGMIAQTLALRHPSRVWRLISMMSSSGDPDLPPGTPEARRALFEPVPVEREANVRHTLRAAQAISGTGFPFDAQRVRRQAERAYDRCFYPMGVARHFMAVLAPGSRRSALRRIKAPTLVIHGGDDPLLPPAHGRDTADAIGHAAFVVIDGMGHDLPPAAWPLLSDHITSFLRCTMRPGADG